MGYAMSTGIEYSCSEVIVLCDAGLSNIRNRHFSQVIENIFSNKADMVLGQVVKTRISDRAESIKLFTGIRAFLKNDILPILADLKVMRNDTDTLVTQYFKFMGKRVKYVLLEELIHFPKAKTQKQ